MNVFGIFLDATSLWLLALVGACLAWFIPHRLSISRERHSSFRLASGKFRSSVLGALTGLYPIPSDWPRHSLAILDVLREKFPAMQAAVAEFRPHLSPLNRELFDRAWRLYRLGEDGRDIDQQYYWQYVPTKGASLQNSKTVEYDNTLTYQENFKKNVEYLLSFAKET